MIFFFTCWRTSWNCDYQSKGEFDRPIRVDGCWWTRVVIIIITSGENITLNSMGYYAHDTLWLGTNNVTGFRFFHRWDRWSFACSTFIFANSTCDCSSGAFEGWRWYSWRSWERHPMRIGGGFRVDRELGFGVEANLGNAHFSLKGMWSVISKP